MAWGTPGENKNICFASLETNYRTLMANSKSLSLTSCRRILDGFTPYASVDVSQGEVSHS